jgi:cell division protein FtsW
MGILLLLGLIVLYSISPVLSHKLYGEVNRNYFLYHQLINIGVALVGFFIAANLHWQKWRKLLPALVVLCGLTTMLLFIPPLSVSKNGATRWIGLGGVSFQPAELLKLTLVVLLASRFAQATREQLNDYRYMFAPTAAILVIVGLLVVIMQRDMGTMLVLAAIVFGLFYASGVSLKQIAALGGLGAGLGTISIILFPHRMARVLTYLSPTQDVNSGGYHLNQALIAIGSGGLFGLGIGKSVQVYGYLPEAASDSIFAIIAETFGMLGSLAVMAVFGLLLYRGFLIVRRAPDRFGSLLVLGIMLWVGSQAAVNIAAMLGLIPLTGIPLPFLSHGGTSLAMIMTAMGVVVNVSKYTERGSYAHRSERRWHGRASYAPAGYGPSTPKIP